MMTTTTPKKIDTVIVPICSCSLVRLGVGVGTSSATTTVMVAVGVGRGVLVGGNLVSICLLAQGKMMIATNAVNVNPMVTTATRWTGVNVSMPIDLARKIWYNIGR